MLHPNRPVGRTLNQRGSAKAINMRVSDSTANAIDELAIKFNLTRSTTARIMMLVALRNKDQLLRALREEA